MAPDAQPPAPAEDEFGFPLLPDEHGVGVRGLSDEGVAQPFPEELEQRLEEIAAWPLTLGVAPAGADLPAPGAGLRDGRGLEETTTPEAGGAEEAARTLETLARRVRAGEIALPAGVRGASEGAILAGVLAALLSESAPGGAAGSVTAAEESSGPGEGR